MKILILGPEPDAGEMKKILKPDFPDVSFLAAKSEDEAGRFIEEAEILLALRISDGLLSRAGKLKWIHSPITGTDFIENLPSFKARKELILSSSRGIHGPQMSEMAVMLMIAMNRQFPRVLRNQDRRLWERWPTRILYQKKVGILGVGAIGEAIAEKCKAFGMTVLGIDPFPRDIRAVDTFYHPDDLLSVMSEVDYFISVVPSTPDTRGILNGEVFSRLKPTAFFINMGRGDVVDEEALIRILRDRKIAGAALDTFLREPLPPESPLWELDNVIITPHVGGASDIYAQQAASLFRENLRRFLKGEQEDMINLIPRG